MSSQPSPSHTVRAGRARLVTNCQPEQDGGPLPPNGLQRSGGVGRVNEVMVIEVVSRNCNRHQQGVAVVVAQRGVLNDGEI